MSLHRKKSVFSPMHSRTPYHRQTTMHAKKTRPERACFDIRAVVASSIVVVFPRTAVCFHTKSNAIAGGLFAVLCRPNGLGLSSTSPVHNLWIAGLQLAEDL